MTHSVASNNGWAIQVKKQPFWREVQVVFADNGLDGEGFGRQVQEQCGVKLHIVKRLADKAKPKGFEVLSHRWLIEQLFGCQGRYRRLSRDYEQNTSLSRATLQGANIHRWLRKLKRAQKKRARFCKPQRRLSANFASFGQPKGEKRREKGLYCVSW